MEQIEYRVRPVTRYRVTRYECETFDDGTETGASSTAHGEFENNDMAYAVAYALCKAEHDRLGWPVDDARIQYPKDGIPTLPTPAVL